MRRLIFATALVGTLSTPAVAQRLDADGTRPSYAKCQSASGGITVNMLDCIGTEYDFQDGILNVRYKALMNRLSPSQRIKLRAEQRRWLQQREPICMKEADEAGGGTLGSVTRNSCMLYSLVGRIQRLKNYRP